MPVDYVRTINGKVFYQAEDLFRMSCVVCRLSFVAIIFICSNQKKTKTETHKNHDGQTVLKTKYEGKKQIK